MKKQQRKKGTGILNYSTTIPTEKTVSEIMEILSRGGASGILMEYSDNDGGSEQKRIIDSISFSMKGVDTPLPLYFKLPANVNGVLVCMKNSKGVPPKFVNKEQAARVAWRIVKDWVAAQVAMVQANQGDMIGMFLQFSTNSNGDTLLEIVRKNNFKLLTGPSGKS